MPIRETMTTIKEFINNLITTEMSTEDINKYNDILKSCDDVINESDLKDKDLKDCKDTLVNIVKVSGNSKKPPEITKEEQKPKSMEEIAQEILKGEK